MSNIRTLANISFIWLKLDSEITYQNQVINVYVIHVFVAIEKVRLRKCGNSEKK